MEPEGGWKRHFQKTHMGRPKEVDLKLSPGAVLGALPQGFCLLIIPELFIHPESERQAEREKLICRKSSSCFKWKPKVAETGPGS